MTEFNSFLLSIGFKDLKNKSHKELEEILSKIYDYCNNKYGFVPGNFFTENWTGNGAIKRGSSDGLDVHHNFEYDPNNIDVCSLSDAINAKMWFNEGYTQYQVKENLTYCNWIEHQAIHVLIDILRTRDFGLYRPGCIDRRAPSLNRFFNDQEEYIEHIKSGNMTCKKYFLKALDAIKDEEDTYILIMDEWAENNNITSWLSLGYEQESLENCFDIQVNE